MYLYIVTYSLIFIYVPIDKETEIKVDLISCAEIYGFNKTIINTTEEIFTSEELELIKYIKNSMDMKKEKINIIARERATYWFLGLTGYNYHPFNLYDKERISNWVSNVDGKYLVLFSRSLEYYGMELPVSNNKAIYKNNAGIILKR